MSLDKSSAFNSDETTRTPLGQPARDAQPPDSPPALAATTNFAPFHEAPGTRIGNYKLLQQIGEGGFGTVFMADQEKPVVRRVALKIIKLGMDTRQVVARFEAERQALAMMDHPNIARVLDAGATDSGRPYFVMELVKGEPITAYCDKHNLSITDRLELFAQTCAAVQHAHQKGLIHRDLKPSNVLVSTQDAKPFAKVIDFGIAKATAGRLTDKTLFTEHRQLIGTPEYMSPEQAEGSLDLDTRTDVYSLGVMLYELLTGVTPFDPVRLRSAAFNEMQRIIREDEPPRPSTRLSTLADEERKRETAATGVGEAANTAGGSPLSVRASTISSEAIARHRRTDVRSLSRFIRGDLDWIVMKALEKDRSRRYSTATSLAEDIARFLANEPVLAMPPSTAYRLRKLVRRRRGVFVALAGVSGAMVLGLGLATYGLLEASHERDKAVASERRAINESDKAVATRQFTLHMIRRAAAPTGRSKELTFREMMFETEGGLLDDGSLANQPEVEFEIRSTLGEVYHSLAQFRQARTQFDKAVALRRRSAGSGDIELARALEFLGTTLIDLEELEQADATLGEAQRLATVIAPKSAPIALDIRFAIATLRWHQGRHEEAAAGFAQLLADYPAAERMGTRDEVNLQSNLASALAALPGRLPDALRASKRAVELQRKLGGPDDAYLAGALQNLAALISQTGDLHTAARTLREALAITDTDLTLSDHNDDAAFIQVHLAAILRDLYETREAEGLASKALKTYRKLRPAGHPLVLASLSTLGSIELDMGDAKQAEELFREALAAGSAPEGAVEFDSSGAMVGIAQALLAQHRAPEAVDLASLALTDRRSSLEPADWRIASAESTLGRVWAATGRPADAEHALLSAANAMENASAAGPRPRLMAVDALIAFYVEQGQESEAAPWRSVRDRIALQLVPTTVVPSPGG